LEEIREYYLEQQVPEIGDRFVREIIALIEDLPVHPDKGRVVPEFNQLYAPRIDSSSLSNRLPSRPSRSQHCPCLAKRTVDASSIVQKLTVYQTHSSRLTVEGFSHNALFFE